MLALTLEFHAGTLLLNASDPRAAANLSLHHAWQLDTRVGRWRAPAWRYHEVFADLHRRSVRGELTVVDNARAYEEVALSSTEGRTPRTYQQEAVSAWVDAGRRGIIVLPTGSGKSFVARLAIQRVGRSTLVVVPTIDLMNQWYSGLLEAFDVDDVGLLGGGYHELRALTVSTYDSAWMHMARYGDRFGLVVFDEVHHLPGPTHLQAAYNCIAPFRLGLTATLERPDGREEGLHEVVGPTVFRREIKQLSGRFLADYDIERITVSLTEREHADYSEARNTYLAFVRSQGIRFDRGGWGDFIMRSSRSAEGRRAMRAYQTQRNIALTCERKVDVVEELLVRHRGERCILFTNDNHTVYALSDMFLLPAITHQTPTKERREILKRFNSGEYRTLVTSKVLNEGVDIPEAGVAIILSGSGTVREHVQRLGRILRPAADKRAVLYEVIAENTLEEGVSERRREHDAYR